MEQLFLRLMDYMPYLVMWLVEILLILYCVHCVFEQSFKWKGITIIIILFDISLMFLIWIEIISVKAKSIIYILLFIYCKVNFKKSVLTTIARFAIGIMVSAFFQLLGGFIGSFWREYIEKEVILMLMVNMLSFTIALFVLNIIGIRSKREHVEYNCKKWKNVIILCGATTFLLIVDYHQQGQTKTIYYIIYLGFCIYVFLRHRNNEIKRLEYEKRILEVDVKKTYEEAYQQLMQDVRKRQHDFKNQLSVLYSMHLTSDSMEELIEKQAKYGEVLLRESRYDSILTGCNNETLAGYLYYKFKEMEQHEIHVEYKISVDKGESVFFLHEFIEIMGILVTNAAESYEGKCSNKIVKIEIIECENEITLLVSNQAEYISGEDFCKMLSYGYSTKGEGRGEGLPRVQELCCREAADIILNNRVMGDDNWVEITLVIPKQKR